MAISYTWDCKTVDVKNIDGNEDTVFNVHWRLIGTDENKTIKNISGEDIPVTANRYGTQTLDTSDLSTFIDFADLTVTNVQSWVESALGEDSIKEIKASISNEIKELISLTEETKTIGE